MKFSYYEISKKHFFKLKLICKRSHTKTKCFNLERIKRHQKKTKLRDKGLDNPLRQCYTINKIHYVEKESHMK